MWGKSNRGISRGYFLHCGYWVMVEVKIFTICNPAWKNSVATTTPIRTNTHNDTHKEGVLKKCLRALESLSFFLIPIVNTLIPLYLYFYFFSLLFKEKRPPLLGTYLGSGVFGVLGYFE